MGLYLNKKKGKPPVLVLEGDVGIAMASDIKNEIMKVMGETESLTVDLGKAERFDISCVQLLCSANRSFEQKAKHLNVVVGKNDDLCQKVLTGSGYEPHGGCPEKVCKRCLWKGEE